MRKALGIVMLIIGVSGVVLSVVGTIIGQRLVADLGKGLEANLTLTLDGLDTVNESLILTKSTVGSLSEGLATVEDTAENVSVAIDDTRPLLQQASTVTTQRVPESIETFQEGLPALIEVAGTVDETMRTLSNFNVDRRILGIPLSFDLGVDYDPEVPFDETVEELGASLEGMPEQLRSLEESMSVTDDNMRAISRNVSEIGRDLSAINEDVAEIEPLLDEYISTVREISDALRQARLSVRRQLDQMRIVVTVIMVWFGLMQIAPLYLGWELFTGDRRPAVEVQQGKDEEDS